MSINVQPKSTIHLDRRDYQRINKVKRGTEVFCDSGVLWVTQSGDYNDYILRAGDAMAVTRRGKILVEAMRDADFHIA